MFKGMAAKLTGLETDNKDLKELLKIDFREPETRGKEAEIIQ
jgi:cell shape-determining protein MreC